MNETGSNGALHLEDRAFSKDPHDLGKDVDKKSWFSKKKRISWWTMTRNYLDKKEHAEINVVIWSWCNIYGHDIDIYLNEMEKLISEYGPDGTKITSGKRKVPVTFVFMTGHTTATPKSILMKTVDLRGQQKKSASIVSVTKGYCMIFSISNHIILMGCISAMEQQRSR